MPNNQIKSLTVDGVTYDIVDETSGYMKGMTILSYGNSTWQDFLTAYNEQKVVYCRASSQSNPASGEQTRLAFMAYVNDADTPTEVEFQYYRSVNTHTEAQQGDQVFVYKLTSAGNWTVTTREASVKVAVGGDLTGSYSNGVYTVSGDIPNIEVEPKVTTGVNIADITVDATTYELYAPTGGGGSVESVGVSNATNGGLSVSGSPITSSGTITIGHSNVLTSAQTTQAVYPIKIDKNGHISAYGSAVTIPVITLNGSSTTSPSFYAPISAGNNGNYLKSNGSGAPVWAGLPEAHDLYYNPESESTMYFEDVGSTLDYVVDTSEAAYGIASTIPSWAMASSKPTYTASEVGALPSNTTYVSTITTTAGAHTAITNKSGTVSFNVPTNTSHLTNDSGFVTTDENVKSTTVTTATTYYLVGSTSSSTTTGELSKHASAYIDVSANSNTGGLSTLTLGNNIADGTAGSKEGNIVLYGLGTTKASIYPNNAMSSNSVFFLPKTGGTIALTSDVTDEKVYVTGFIDSGATYYPILATGSGTDTRQIDYYGALRYTSTAGSSSTKGTAILELGNSTASGTAHNEYGVLRLYGTTTKYYDLKTYPDYPAANRTIYFPRYTSDMYLTCTSSTSAVGGATTKPVYVDDTGCIKAVTSIPYSLLTGVPTVNSNTTGISISNHSTGSVTGVQSSTTTASKVTLGTAISVPNVTAVGSGSFTQGSFNGGSLTFAIDSTDDKQLNITFTAATHGADSHTHTAPTLGTAKSIPNVTGVSDVTVPIKNTSATTVVTSATHTVTDNGHTHNLS